MSNDDDPKKKRNPPHLGAVPQVRETPPPAASPAAPGLALGDDDGRETPTGEHPITKNELRRWGNLNDLKQGVAMICVAIGAVFGAYKLVLNDAGAQVDLKQAVIVQRHEDLQKEVTQLRESTDASFTAIRDEQKRQQAETAELRTDLREFYRAWRDDKRSARLDAPLDGGR